MGRVYGPCFLFVFSVAVFTVREESALRLIAHAFPVRERRVRADAQRQLAGIVQRFENVEIVPHALRGAFSEAPGQSIDIAEVAHRGDTQRQQIPERAMVRGYPARVARFGNRSRDQADGVLPYQAVRSCRSRDATDRFARRIGGGCVHVRRCERRVAREPGVRFRRSTHTGRSGYFVSTSASAIQEASGTEGGSQRLSSQPPPRSHVEASSPSASIRSAAARVAPKLKRRAAWQILGHASGEMVVEFDQRGEITTSSSSSSPKAIHGIIIGIRGHFGLALTCVTPTRARTRARV